MTFESHASPPPLLTTLLSLDLRYCESLSMLAVRLSTREARQALAASYLAASRLLPEAAAPAELLGHLCAWSAAQLDEVRGGRGGGHLSV